MSGKIKEFTPGRGYTKEDWDEVSDPHEPTAEQWAQAKPFAEMFPELAASIKRARGKQKAPTKELISLRVDREVVAAYRATGANWQSRMNAALKAAIAKPRKAAGK
jgi:uncharacterized protein (DUF4415 family)